MRSIQASVYRLRGGWHWHLLAGYGLALWRVALALASYSLFLLFLEREEDHHDSTME